MKKLTLLFLACVSIGVFAQETQGINDQIKNTHIDNDIAFIDYTKAVSNLPNSDLSLNENPYHNNFLEDPISAASSEEKIVISKKYLRENINSMIREGMVSFSKDRKTVFFSVNRKIRNVKSVNGGVIETKRAVNLQLFKASVNDNGEWVDLEMLPFNSSRYSTGQPFLNHNETKLYFVSDGPGSLGRTDIFVVDINTDGTYGDPVNLGPKINRTEREIFPFIDEENILYFSSDVQNKKGDLDIFATKIFDNTMSIPVKLEGSIPTGKSEFTYDIIENVDSNTFSSREQSGKGVEEIYATVNAKVNFECEQKISGVVKTRDTQELLSNVRITLYDDNKQELSSFRSNETDATFSFTQSCNTAQTLKAYLDGYLVEEMTIETVNDLNSAPLEIVMNMAPNENVIADTNKQEEIVIAEAVDKTKDESSPEMAHQSNNTDDAEIIGSSYNFNGDQEVFTVQIGAFEGNAETNKYMNLKGLFNHVYPDGYNRYFSGVFNSRSEAMTYLKQLKENGYNDAYIIRLKGKKRF